MKKQFVIATLALGLFLASCNASSDNPAASKDIHADPVTVVEEIFSAAKSGDFSKLSDLCDPSGAGDGDSKMICNISSQPQAKQDDFKNYFQKGQVVGDAAITGNEAKVKIKFGPDGTKDEEFNLVKVAGKWYIASF